MQTNRYLIALVAALGLIPIVLDSTIVTVALTPIRINLNASVDVAQWIITGYLLANAAFVIVGGYFANRFGRKQMFILGITSFVIGSLLCGIAPSIGWLIAFRVLQGIGGGLLLPIGPALAFDAFPKEERAKASAVVGVPLLLAPVFGPIVGGYLNDTFGWHSIFFINLPVGFIAVVVALVVLPRDVPSATRHAGFDYIGLALSTLGIVAILYALKLVTETNPTTISTGNPTGDLYGWGYWLVWTLIGAGMVVLGIFAWYSLRISADPALDLKQLGRRDFLVSNLVAWTTALITFGLLVLLPLYFEAVRLPHLSAFDTGVALITFGIGTLVGTIVAAALYRAIGPRWVVISGVALSGASAWLLTQVIHPTATAGQLVTALQSQTPVPSTAGPTDIRWLLFLVGMGIVMVAIAVQTLALEALNGAALAKASSLVIATKLIFSSVGVAIITSIFAAQTRSRATDLVGQVQTLGQGAGGNASGSALQAIMAQIAAQAGTWAIQNIFWLIFLGSFGLLALALALPGRHRQLAATQTEPVQPGSESVPATA